MARRRNANNSINNDNTKGNTRDINAANRAVLALQLRAQKLTYDEIAQRAGYNDRAAAHKAVQREMSRVVVENVESLRREELLTLDIMQTECMQLFMDQDNKGRLFAADRILQILERRAKLMNLDKRPEDVLTAQVIVREIPAGYLGAEEVRKDG